MHTVTYTYNKSSVLTHFFIYFYIIFSLFQSSCFILEPSHMSLCIPWDILEISLKFFSFRNWILKWYRREDLIQSHQLVLSINCCAICECLISGEEWVLLPVIWKYRCHSLHISIHLFLQLIVFLNWVKNFKFFPNAILLLYLAILYVISLALSHNYQTFTSSYIMFF